MPAKQLPDPALDPVPDDRGADLPAGNDRQAGIAKLIPAEDQAEMPSPKAVTLSI